MASVVALRSRPAARRRRPILAVAVAVVVAARAPAADSPEWSQAHADAANSRAVDQEPIRGEPAEAWRHRFDGVLQGPVINAGRAFAVVREGSDRRLLAIDAARGTILGRKTLDKGQEVAAIAVIDGLVVLVDAEKVKTFKLVGDTLRGEKTIAGAGGEDACALDGTVLVRAAGVWKVVDPVAAKVFGSVDVGRGRPSFRKSSKGDWHSNAPIGTDSAGNLKVSRNRVRLGSKTHAFHENTFVSGHIPDIERHLGASLTVVAEVDFVEHLYLAFPTQRGLGGSVRERAIGGLAFVEPPIALGGQFVGFTDERELVELDPVEGTYRILVRDELPAGAVRGAPSRARDVIYHGNWALEIAARRVLWCMPAVEPDGPLVPAGDGRAVLRVRGGTLVGWCERLLLAAAGGAEVAADGAPPAASKPAAPPRLPSDDPALAERVAGDQQATFAAFEAALAVELQAAWRKLFDRYAEFKLWDECRRVATAAKAAGLEEARVQELIARATGKASSNAGNAELQKKKVAGEEREALRSHRDRIVAAADWCGGKQLPMAATVLARRAAALLPDGKLDAAQVAGWIPAEFPWRVEGAADGGAQKWAEWAEALLPSGAKFVAGDDPLWKRVEGTPFAKDAAGLRSANLLLWTRELEPDVVGPALTRGEAVVAALARFLPPGAQPGPRAAEPLEVRLHATRDDYLNDKIAGDAPPIPWSSGVYVPAEQVSRFFVRGEAEGGDPTGRSLHGTLAHELTHHWLDVRWIRSDARSSRHPGIWLIEGFADFIGEQSVEAARRGGALDDVTVVSHDMVAAAAKEKALLPLRELLAIDAVKFHTGLDGKERVLALRHTLKQVKVDPRSLFYAQSATLTFFALHRCGEAGRTGYVELLTACYLGRPLGDVAKKLGFADAIAFENAFTAFIASL